MNKMIPWKPGLFVVNRMEDLQLLPNVNSFLMKYTAQVANASTNWIGKAMRTSREALYGRR